MAETRKPVDLTRRLVSVLPAAFLAVRATHMTARGFAMSAAALLPGTSPAARRGPYSRAAKEVELSDFDRLVLEVPAEIRIAVTGRSHARLEAASNVIDSIAFSMRGRTLRVSARSSFETRDPIIIAMTCRAIASLEASASADATLEGLSGGALAVTAAGSASVTLNGLNLGSLTADLGGSATVTAEGRAGSQQISAGGAATYQARRLRSGSARVDATGSSDVVVECRDSLEVAVSGAATVQYAGNPKVTHSIKEAGTLERLEEEPR